MEQGPRLGTKDGGHLDYNSLCNTTVAYDSELLSEAAVAGVRRSKAAAKSMGWTSQERQSPECYG